MSGRRPLHLDGDVPPSPRLAVVGSRAAHRRFREAVAPVVRAAAGRRFSLVSGGAVGIDADVHAAALAQGVPQLAVVPCGPDRPYPPQHVPLFDRIAAAADSGVLYAHGPGTTPTRGMFASRNAIVVALCEAVVVVEAAPRSGTMLTATLARRKQRPRAVVTGSAGAAVLVAGGAHALPWDPAAPEVLTRAVDAWLRAVAAGEPEPAVVGAVWPEHLHWLREALASAGPAGLSVDALARPRVALRGLSDAQARGLVVERSPGRYVATR
ncbi:MAG: DNA-processing protein DprA [Myxococcota bacterium]